METVRYIDFGTIAYRECLAEQERIFGALVAEKEAGIKGAGTENKAGAEEAGAINERRRPAGETGVTGEQVFIVCEHPNVYTLGRSGQESNMLVDAGFLSGIGAEMVRTDRGGDITYHGPGQIVGYPILDLERLGIGVRDYVRALEETVIGAVGDFGIEAGRLAGATGVWIQDGGVPRKICAIGIRTSRWITMHGFALNVSTRMEYFDYINPCGFTDKATTSMERETGLAIGMEDVKEALRRHFEENMNVKIK